MGCRPLNRLTDTLRAEHSAILRLIEEAHATGIGSQGAFESLRKSKALIIAHLRKEERELYPPLFASCDFAAMGDVFSAEMVRLSQTIIRFFERYETVGAADSGELAPELDRIIGLLHTRIAREENTLYPAFEKVVAEPA